MNRNAFLLVLLFILLAACGPAQSPTSTPQPAGPTPAGSGSEAYPAPALSSPEPPAAYPGPDLNATAAAQNAASAYPAPETEAPAMPTLTPPPAPTRAPVPTTTPTAEPAAAADTSFPAGLPGALIGVEMRSQVGVLLDELFPAERREEYAEALINAPEREWLARAARQVRLTRLRLNFRDFRYAGKGQLPLPPQDLWQIELADTPVRATIDGQELVMLEYTFRTTILTDEASPGTAEPALAEIGGVWDEPFVFPADPDHLYQRTSNACINEAGFPPNSYDSVNLWHFYDFLCTADSTGALGCHRTVRPALSCQQALAQSVGRVQTSIRFERLAWDDELADSVRLGPFTTLEQPDLQVVDTDLDINRIVYSFIEPEDCAIEEGAVGAAGWRRLLQFDATIHNVGGVALHIGRADTEDVENNVFDYNACHGHFHYANYGSFFLQNLADLTGSKQAFCVQSTNRLSNNETSPLIHSYSCRMQGVQAGWVDEYIAGLDAQWIDITDLELPEEGREVQLGFTSNGERFLCEGERLLGEDGEPLWEPSEFTDEHGETMNRPACEFIDDWDSNNEGVRPVFVAQTGGYVTGPCREGQLGGSRNCGFSEIPLSDTDYACRPGQSVTLQLSGAMAEAPQAVRVCERSAALGTGVACTFNDAVAQLQTADNEAELAFRCPAIRDAGEDGPNGGFSLYAGPIWPADGAVELVVERP